MSIEKVFPIFAAAFAVIYVFAVQYNWALFTYHPKIGEWEWLAQPAKNGARRRRFRGRRKKKSPAVAVARAM